MAPSYKLYYFNVTGRGEPIRMILSYGGLQFEDVRIEKPDWPKVKPTTPLGQLPYLDVDGKKITQSLAICRYLANIVNLAGENNEENLEIDAAVDIIFDLIKSAYEFQFEPEEPRKQKLGEKLQDLLPVLLGVLEENAKNNGGYVAVNRLTWADIVFLCAYEDVRNILEGKDFLANYPNLQQVKQNVLSVDNLKEWIQKRPVMTMYVYDLRKDL